MKTNKIFMLTMVMALSMFTIGCTESDDMTEITPQQEKQKQQETETPLSDDFSETLEAIQGVSDVTVEDNVNLETETVTRYYTFYVQQFVDHSDLAKGTFKQRVRISLSPEGVKAPVVFYSHGYSMPDKVDNIYVPTIATQLKASTLFIEHRYFGKSLPEPFEDLNFTYLYAEQAANDLHAIITLLKQTVFKESGKWISTGVSKDGITTGLYAYFSDPANRHYNNTETWNDIDLYMPFCAPFLEGTPTSCDDPKMGKYLYEECGKGYAAGSQEAIAFERLQRIPKALLQDMALRNICMSLYHQKDPDEYLDVINTFGRTEENATAGLLFTYFGNLFGKFSYVPFKQWSYLVPDIDAATQTATTAEEETAKIVAISQLAGFIFMDENELLALLQQQAADDDESSIADNYSYPSDGQEPSALTDAELLSLRGTDYTMPYYVQAARELGSIHMEYTVLNGLNYPGSTQDFGYLATSVGKQLETKKVYERYSGDWDGGKLMKDFRQWVKTQSKYNMIFAYSHNDPWTGGAIDDSTNPKVKRIIARNGTHNDSFLNPDCYTEEEKQQLLGWVRDYLGTTAR